MPKPYTLPTLLDKANKLEISFLRKHGYLNPNNIKSGVIRWSINGKQVAGISATACTITEPPYIELDYSINQTPKRYRVTLFNMPSNLGRGVVWYFICPLTERRCRKLYFVNGIFCHRTAVEGCLYESQTLSKSLRDIDKRLRAMLQVETICSELEKKYLKKHYGGKPTKIYLKLTQKMQATFPLVG